MRERFCLLRRQIAAAVRPYAADRLRRCALNRLFLFLCLGSFRGFGSFHSFRFLRHLTLRFLFDAAMLFLNFALLRFLAQPGVLDLALALLDVLAFSRLDQRAGTGVHLACGQLTEHLLRALICTIGSRFLEGAMLRFRRCGFHSLLRLFRQAMDGQPLALRLNKNRFGAPMAEVLADMALFHRPLHIQRHGLPASSRFVVRFFRFGHSLPWRRELFAISPEQ